MPRKRSPVADALESIRAACAAVGADWYLFGAQAALLYGSARLTADIDVTVRLGDVRTSSLVDALRAQGCEPRIDDPAFIAETRVIPIVHQDTAIPADVVLAGPGLEDLFLSRATVRDVGGAKVPVVAPEDLIVLKVLAGREKDKADVRAVLRSQRNALDVASIRETLRMLEEALGQSDLTPLFDELSASLR